MKKIKLTGQQIKFIVNMLSIAVFAVAYLYIYTGYEEKATAAYEEIKEIEATINQLSDLKVKEATLLQNIEASKNELQGVIDQYPINIEKENSFLFVEQLQKDLDIRLSSVNITDATQIYTTILPIRNEDGTEVPTSAAISSDASVAEGLQDEKASYQEASAQTNEADSLEQELGTENIEGATDSSGSSEQTGQAMPQTMTGLEATISMNFETSYQGFKKLADYIANYPEQTSIDSVSVSFDSTTGNLTGSLVIKRYALTGTGKTYKDPMIDDIRIGTDNIFGTGTQ